jgi:glycosyltransferase involved in cell wall biosynthesis
VKSVAIFREALLAPSETFVLGQASALERFRPILVGLRRAMPSLVVQPEVLLTPRTGAAGKLISAAYRVTGIAPQFHRRVEERAPALLHAHFGPDGAIALPLRSRLDVPLVVTLHGFDVTMQDSAISKSLRGRHYLSLRNKLFDDASLFLCVSQYLYKRALEKGFPEKKLAIHYLGVDTSRFSRDCEINEGRDLNTILFVGRLVPVKGCEYLIRAAALLGKRGLRPKLVIIGGGELEEELRALACELGVDARFEGQQPPDVVRHWLLRSCVFCVPSVTADDGQCEAFGLAFAEAQAMGTPVVSSCTGGIPEAVLDRETGLLAPEKDAHALALLLERLLTDGEFWSKCAMRGRTHVLENFDLQKQTCVLECLYEYACGSVNYRQQSPLREP